MGIFAKLCVQVQLHSAIRKWCWTCSCPATYRKKCCYYATKHLAMNTYLTIEWKINKQILHLRKPIHKFNLRILQTAFALQAVTRNQLIVIIIILTCVLHTCISPSYPILGKGTLYSLGFEISSHYFFPGLFSLPYSLHPGTSYFLGLLAQHSSSTLSTCPNYPSCLLCIDFLVQFNPSWFLNTWRPIFQQWHTTDPA